ncbi:MAG: shufflon system plasmid conjugative transfer pilus tip adhesin PilV [Bacteroidetes bacterium]|nr:shufflon system plasmid conjugative transfer pilus tip adhesin PilV [Bacteroidota bacterium]
MKTLLTLALSFMLLQYVAAQNVAINATGNPPDSKAMLDVASTTSGILIPRMTAAQRGAILTPPTGLVVYQITDVPTGFYYYDGSSWVRLFSGSQSSDWTLAGNSLGGTEFIGSTNAQPFIIRTNNSERVRILSTGEVGIGTSAPGAPLQVNGGTSVTGTIRGGNGIIISSRDEWLRINDDDGAGDVHTSGIYMDGQGVGIQNGLCVGGATLPAAGVINIVDANTNILEGAGNAIRLRTNSGYVDVGPQNASWSHFVTDRSRFYFNTGGTFDSGNIGSYDENLSLQTSGTTRVTILNSNGYVGISTTSPGAKLGFNDLNDGSNGADGITWYNPSPLSYGIYRTAGAWSGPNYQQLKLGWETGITIDGGSAYGLSGTLIQPTAGTVGIGQSVKAAYNLEVNGSLGYGDGTAGSYRSRTESRADAGLMGSQSGFFQTSAPAPAANWPGGAASWWHLLDVRHSNNANNYAMQFAGSFFDQNLYFRKTNNNAAQAWSQILTTANGVAGSGTLNYIPKWTPNGNTLGNSVIYDNGNVGIGTTTNSYKLHVAGDIYADGGWLRTSGNAGWYSESYCGGWYMSDGTWIRSYCSKNVYCDQVIRADGGFQVDGNQVIDADGSWHRSYGNAGWYNGTWGGGWYMQDGTWIRNYNSRPLYIYGDGTTATYFDNGRVQIKNGSPDANSTLDVKGIAYVGDWGGCGSNYRFNIGWYFGCDPAMHAGGANYGYVGTAANYLYYVYSNNFVDPSRRELKRNITPLNTELYSRVMDDIDNIQPSFYKYKFETDFVEKGNETKYRPNFHLGVILDESPDYIQDNAFTGIDVYALAALGIAGVKQNRKEIIEMKERLAIGTTSATSDFGVAQMNGNEVVVSFSEDFTKKISSQNNLPVVTVTPSGANASLYISDVTPSGFKVTNSTINQSPVTFNWIAMAKVTTGTFIDNNRTSTQIPPGILNQIKVPEDIKRQTHDYFLNLETTVNGGK